MTIDAPAELVKNLDIGTDYQIESARFSGNGEYLTGILAARPDKAPLPTKNGVWRTRDWTLVDERTVHPDSKSSCVADNGEFVAGAYNNDETNGYFTFLSSTPADLPTDRELDIGAIRREALSMSSDGTLLVFGCGRSLVFDLSTEQSVFDVQRNEVHMSAISGDNRLAAFCYVDGVIDVIDLDTHRILATVAQRPQSQRQLDFPALAFSGDNKFLVATNAESLTVWSLDSDRTQLPGHRNGVSSLVYAADGKALISGGHDDVVRISSLISMEPPKELQCGGAVQCIRLIPDRKWLVIGVRGGNKPCQVLSSETLEPLLDLAAVLGPIVGVALTPDGSCLVAAGDQGIGVWQLKIADDGRISSTRLHTPELRASEPRDLNIGSGNIVAWTTRDIKSKETNLHLFNLKTNKQVDITPKPKVRQFGWHGVQYFPKSGDLAFVNDRGMVERCKPDGSMVARYGEDQIFSSSIIAISHDERFIAGAAEVGRVAIWNTETNTRLFDLPIIGEPWSLAWHPAKHELAIGLSTGQIVRWHLDSIQSRLRDLGLDWE
jgi:WD40 repeat protein